MRPASAFLPFDPYPVAVEKLDPGLLQSLLDGRAGVLPKCLFKRVVALCPCALCFSPGSSGCIASSWRPRCWPMLRQRRSWVMALHVRFATQVSHPAARILFPFCSCCGIQRTPSHDGVQMTTDYADRSFQHSGQGLPKDADCEAAVTDIINPTGKGPLRSQEACRSYLGNRWLVSTQPASARL